MVLAGEFVIPFKREAPRAPSDPDPVELASLLAEGVRRNRKGLALTGPPGLAFTHAELQQLVEHSRQQLRQAGLARRDRVVLVAPDGADSAAAVLVLACGCICAPLSAGLPAPALVEQLRRIAPQAVVLPAGGHRAAAQAAAEAGLPVVHLAPTPSPEQGVLDTAVERLTVGVGPAAAMEVDAAMDLPSGEDVALLLATSGTTARPRLVPLSHANLCAAATGIRDVLELVPGDRCLDPMPLAHIHGLSLLFASLAAGARLHCPGPFSEESFLAGWQDCRPTWFSAAPAMHGMIIDWLAARPELLASSELRLVRSASAPMPRAWLERIESLLEVPLIEAYGMTEAAPQISSNRLPPHVRKPGSVGRAAGPEIAVLDPQGRPLPPGTVGEVMIRGANVMRAYDDDPEADQQACHGTWRRTGDLGHLDEDGDLFLCGRRADRINRGGLAITPQPIEAVLLSHPWVRDAVVFPLPHPVLGQNVAAAVIAEATGGGREELLEELRALVAARLGAVQVPQPLLIVPALPTEAGGKRRRRGMAERLGLLTADPLPVAPLRGTESQLGSLWAEVLPTAPNAPTDNFFMLGGHSLAAIRLLGRLEQSISLRLPASWVFEQPTLAAQAADLGRRLSEALLGGEHRLVPSAHDPTAEEVPRGGGGPAPLSPAQQGLWLQEQLGPGPAYAMAMGWDLHGPLEAETLRRSLSWVVARHPGLRTVFCLEGRRPLQRVVEAADVELPLINRVAQAGPNAAAEGELSEAAWHQEVAAFRSAPFNLERGPLLRAMLLRLGLTHHRLLIAVHHIVFDRWSAGLFRDDLAHAYRVLVRGGTPERPPLPLTPIDEALRQERRRNGAEERQLTDHWRRRLAGAPLLSTFPAARPRPERPSGRGAGLRRPLDRATREGLEGLARRSSASLFMVILAALQSLLGRYAGQEDVVVGAAMAQRSRPELEPLIGCFASSVVPRGDLAGDPSFVAHLTQVRAASLEAFAHADVSIERLVEALAIPRSLGHTPLFQVMLAFQNLPEAGDAAAMLEERLRAEPLAVDDGGAKFDVTLYVEPGAAGELCLRWQYATDLHDAASIGRLAEHFAVLLERIIADPDQPLSRLTRLPEAEARRVVALGAGPVRPDLLGTDPGRAIEKWARRTPEAPALVGWGGQLGSASVAAAVVAAAETAPVTLSYAELNGRANQLARRLQQRGRGPGERIGLLLPRTPDMIICLLAITKLGAAFVGLDPLHPPERILWMVEDADLALVLSNAEHAHLAGAVVLTLEELGADLDREDAGDLRPLVDPDFPAYLLYTSGSTGHPKGVLVTRANLCHYEATLGEALGVQPQDRWLHTASLSFSSSVRQAFVPLAAGACVVVAPAADVRNPLALWRLIGEQRVSVVDLVPSHWSTCHAALATLEPADRDQLLGPGVRLLLSASEAMPASQPRQWASLLSRGARLFQLYGQTETTGIVTLKEIDEAMVARAEPLPIGRPIANLHCRVLDRQGRIVPVGTTGELHLGGAGIGAGYWRRPELSAEQFRPDPLHPGERLYASGDLAVLLPDGDLLLKGRRDRQLKQSGVRVEPGEIEALLLEEERVAMAAVVTAGGDLPSRMVAFVEAPGDGCALAEALRERLRRRLPAVMHPHELVVRERLPRTVNGKIDRGALAREAGAAPRNPATPSRPIARRPYLAPSTPQERILARIWAEVLALPQVGIDDNFFELGGDSLRSVQVVERARAAGLDLDLTSHFQHQTIAAVGAARWAGVPAGNAQAAEMAEAAGSAQALMVPIDALRTFGRKLLEQVGLDPEGARLVAEVQLESSLRGQQTHHIDSLPRYARRLRTGTLNGRPQMRIENDGGIAIRLDGDNAPGQWVASVAMDLAIARAQEQGIGLVTARRSNHFGAAGHYAWQAARQGLLGFCTTNGPVILAPTGGTTPTFGNNPIGVGIPAGQHPPVLLDFAMTVAPRGRIAVAVANGTPLAPGWILDGQGRPSTDLADLAAGLGMPIGGHKGYGLALVLEILSGVLSGAGFGLDHGRHLLGAYAGGADFGHFFLAIDPSLLLPRGEFLERVDRLIAQTKAGVLAEGSDGILIPGERELRARERSLARGTVPLTALSWRILERYAKEAGVKGLPEPLPGPAAGPPSPPEAGEPGERLR